jgi:hypothetical protein
VTPTTSLLITQLALLTSATPTTRTGRWGAIHFTSNTHVNAIVAQNYDGNTISGQTFSAATTLYGVFTSITLQNGHCVAYKL